MCDNNVVWLTSRTQGKHLIRISVKSPVATLAFPLLRHGKEAQSWSTKQGLKTHRWRYTAPDYLLRSQVVDQWVADSSLHNLPCLFSSHLLQIQTVASQMPAISEFMAYTPTHQTWTRSSPPEYHSDRTYPVRSHIATPQLNDVLATRIHFERTCQKAAVEAWARCLLADTFLDRPLVPPEDAPPTRTRKETENDPPTKCDECANNGSKAPEDGNENMTTTPQTLTKTRETLKTKRDNWDTTPSCSTNHQLPIRRSTRRRETVTRSSRLHQSTSPQLPRSPWFRTPSFPLRRTRQTGRRAFTMTHPKGSSSRSTETSWCGPSTPSSASWPMAPSLERRRPPTLQRLTAKAPAGYRFRRRDTIPGSEPKPAWRPRHQTRAPETRQRQKRCLLTMDLENAFNHIDRSCSLREVRRVAPTFATALCHFNDSCLFGSEKIPTKKGVQQGLDRQFCPVWSRKDPEQKRVSQGSLLFALGLEGVHLGWTNNSF